MKSHNDGYMRTSLTKYSQYIVGRRSFSILILSLLIVQLLPWKIIFDTNLFQYYLEIIINIFPNLKQVPDNITNFPEAATAHMAIMYIVGPLYVFISIYFSYLHINYLRTKNISIDVKPLLRIFSIFFFSFIIICFVIFIFKFTGESTVIKGIYNASRWKYILIVTGSWWAIGSISFALSFLLQTSSKNKGVGNV